MQDYAQIESSQRQWNDNHLFQQELEVVYEKQLYNLFAMLRPKVTKDGNKYCVLYGNDLQDGIAGFGDTIHLAILDFNQQFHKPIIKAS